MSDLINRLRARLANCKAAGEPSCWDIPVSKADLLALLEMAEAPTVVVSSRADYKLHRAAHPLGEWPMLDP